MSSPRAGWLANLPLTFKLLFAFGLVYACFLATAVFVLQTFSRDSRLQKQERQQIELIRHVESAGQKMRAQQIAIRNYILDGDRQHLEVEQAARKHRDDDLAKAMELSGNGRGAELETARNAAHAWDVGIEAFLQEDGNTTVTEQRNQLGRAYLKEHSQHVSQLLEKLDRMYETEVERYVDERTLMGRYIAFAQTFMLLMLVGSVALIVVVLWLVSRLVATPIRTLSAQMTQLAEGQLDIVVAGQSRKDEVGSIARALEVFRANAIRSTENNWVKISAGEVMNALQSVDSPTAFCETLVAEVSPRIGAGIGVFFQWDEQGRELHLSGSYGFLHRKHLGLHYALGEGLTGQSAKERKRITLENVPDDYFGIHSATGESRPRHVVAQPLLLRDRLLGVFEFASFRPFTAAQQAFLDEILPAAALGLDNIRGVENTQHLLSRTQAQAEELQRSSESLRAQEEELRATNEELQGKTVELEEHAQRLSASEEELRVQAEELQASNEELRQKTETLNAQKDVLQELQRETEFKAQQLAQASQYKTDFLANMSHELRTPLNSLLILSRELADNGSGHLDPDEVEAAQVIHDSGSNLLRLINDILDLSKIEAGKMDVHLDEVEIALVGQEVQRHFRHVASDKHLAFTLDVAADVPPVLLTDRPKLQQVLNNLLGNAFKFTHSGSVALNIVMATAPLLMRVGAPTTARYVAISVTDTGIGIPEDRLESIFEAFEQVDSSTSRHYGGSGLGLAIARRLAGLLGGQLLADSDVGTGSTFTLVLPVQAPASVLAQLETAAEPSIPGLPRRGGDAPLIDWIQDDRHTLAPGEKAILTIEDDLAFARILVDMIRRKGYRALAAADGESGLELARRHRPTGILLDVMLPGMDGWSVMQHLHQDPVTASIPVHFISAVDAAEKGQALGAVGYLTKPVDRQSLTQAFDRLMEVAGKIVRRLLLVDDDRDSRLALARLLQDDRVEIDEATSGEEALRLVAERNYDCIVLDLNLDGISGTEFLQRASAQVTLPPVVIYSGQDLGREESLKLRQYTDSIVIKGERSPQRLLDEVSLFLHSIDASGRPSSGNGGESDLAGRCVLLVDDDMRNLFALSKALRARGLEVLMAQDGYKALHQLQEHPEITLVMMDIMMPGMDGYEAIGEIRKHPQWQDLPIIAITAKAMQGDRDKCLAAGANDYLAKPVDLDKLLSMIRAWLPA